MMMLQVQTATDCTRYFQGVAGAVTSPPPPPPPSNRCQHGLITRHTRVSLQFPFLRLRFLRRPKITRGYFWSANALHALHFIQKELKHFRNPFIFIRYKLLLGITFRSSHLMINSAISPVTEFLLKIQYRWKGRFCYCNISKNLTTYRSENNFTGQSKQLK